MDNALRKLGNDQIYLGDRLILICYTLKKKMKKKKKKKKKKENWENKENKSTIKT